MANQVLSFLDLQNAINLYQALPSATLFRGLTGYGLVVDGNDQEIIAEVSEAKAIWKPMYMVISGGLKHGREKLSAEMIQLCLEEFQKNPLLAVLKSTSGYGLGLDGNGMVELVEARDATTPITFEISHFGGRSILAMLSTQLGKIVSQEIEWKGGFSYQNERNHPVKAGDTLILNRLLSTDDLDVERILADVVRETNRLSLMNTDGSLPHVHNGGIPIMQIFLRQELTALVPGTQLDRQHGFNYTIRPDSIEVQIRLSNFHTSSEANFETAFNVFQKECTRVQMLYCQPLTENQRQKAGKPSNEVFATSDVQWLSWQAANRGNGVIAFHPTVPRKKDAVFPTEGWNPQKGERHRVLCLRKGNGFTGFPAPPAYVERYVKKDEYTASLQLVLVNFDGREKVVSEKDVPLTEKWEWEDGKTYTPRFEKMENGFWIVEQICGYRKLKREKVEEEWEKDVNGKPRTSIHSIIEKNISCPAERRFRPEKIWLQPTSWGKDLPMALRIANPFDVDFWRIKSTAKNPDGGRAETESEKYKWDELPEDLRIAHLAEWPLCQCGRSRHARNETQCDLCHDYRSCADCGKETKFGEVVEEAAEEEIEPDPELASELAPESESKIESDVVQTETPADSDVATKSDALDFSALAKAWGARLVRKPACR